jgi:hypothetical protein
MQGKGISMNFREAALRVLRDEGKALHYEEISRLALERGYIEPRGKTPEDSISTELSRDMRKNGIKSEFLKVDRGTYSLREFEKGGGVPEKPVQSYPVYRDIVL